MVCPECGSSRTWKDGLRYVQGEAIQRYLCRNCGYRFSEKHYKGYQTTRGRQICALKTKRVKNLVTVETRNQKWAAGATKLFDDEINGKLVEFLWWMKKRGWTKSTVKIKLQSLRRLMRIGADLFDPESVKQVLASHDEWSSNYKRILIYAYHSFIKMLGIPWEIPNCKTTGKLPFIPLESEIDALIAGCGKKVATSLQLMKETGMRIGEAWNLEWIDVDQQRCTIKCQSEKYGNPRMFKVSNRLLGMLNSRSKDSEKVFGATTLKAHRSNFNEQRKRLAQKLQNPRLLKISFHTLRHWKATMEYHKTKDILHVKQLLGHRSINSTMIYTHLINWERDDYHVRVAKTLDDACKLAEAGFEYFTEIDNSQIFRKRK